MNVLTAVLLIAGCILAWKVLKSLLKTGAVVLAATAVIIILQVVFKVI
jgi:hypothetical protein